MMKKPKPQLLQSLDLQDYRVRIVVAGTRGYNNRREFHEIICQYLETFEDPVLFISGGARTGADHLIIEWCNKFDYPCKIYPAFWESEGKIAGFLRNERMAKAATDLITFHDGVSPGTADMKRRASFHQLRTLDILIEIPPPENQPAQHHGRDSDQPTYYPSGQYY